VSQLGQYCFNRHHSKFFTMLIATPVPLCHLNTLIIATTRVISQPLPHCHPATATPHHAHMSQKSAYLGQYCPNSIHSKLFTNPTATPLPLCHSSTLITATAVSMYKNYSHCHPATATPHHAHMSKNAHISVNTAPIPSIRSFLQPPQPPHCHCATLAHCL
jgi:hypothetical protein